MYQYNTVQYNEAVYIRYHHELVRDVEVEHLPHKKQIR